MSGAELLSQRKEWSLCKLTSFKTEVASLDDINTHTDLCIYVTGSFGRLEASSESDLDLFFIKAGTQADEPMSHIDKTLMDASLIQACRRMNFPEFSGDGKYLEIHHLQDITKNLGGRSDDFDNSFTARLLLLLESLPVYNDALYDDFIQEITKAYFRDYPDHENNFRPTFLVNDIIRFWKTLCLNYEHSRNEPNRDEVEIRKSQLKNLKLKFSRMLTCFSLVIPLAVPRTSMEPETCVALMQERPLERLRIVAENSGHSELWDTLAEDYGWFLNLTGQPQDDVLDWVGSSDNRIQAFGRARQFGDRMYSLLTEVASPEARRYLVI